MFPAWEGGELAGCRLDGGWRGRRGGYIPFGEVEGGGKWASHPVGAGWGRPSAEVEVELHQAG